MASPPRRRTGARLCLTVTKKGVTGYGNRQAFAALAEWMMWLANSKESEHFECHVGMALEDDDSKFHGKKPGNVSVLFDKSLVNSFEKKSKSNTGFELTFIVLEPADLDSMDKLQEAGVVPDKWGKGT